MTKPPADSSGGSKAPVATSSEVAAFLRQVAVAPKPSAQGSGRGRLIFAMDATASRQATWTEAQQVQAEMFKAVAGIGGLDIQLVFFRGLGECRASDWVSRAPDLLRLMRQVQCVGGHTQIERVLRHTLAEARESRVNALVYVGDCLEESPDDIAVRAGELAMLGVPIFAFQEGEEPRARACFQEMARLTRGAYCSFDRSSAAMLAQLLSAVAVYAAGGHRALADYAERAGPEVRLLSRQMKG
ncbi:VWA domain-containing protein [Ferrovibrio sp.]|uniref:VWA domain-containing protein n=1 Tax=Ferrovibrio sp. TaxID=1917215 RepID=UPI0025B9F9E3|nr:VWA domain-containing protein [Ferrovibrio sp.]MBX3454064.1 VWA domain-containing protein [Ferrovibrio sp.]